MNNLLFRTIADTPENEQFIRGFALSLHSIHKNNVARRVCGIDSDMDKMTADEIHNQIEALRRLVK